MTATHFIHIYLLRLRHLGISLVPGLNQFEVFSCEL